MAGLRFNIEGHPAPQGSKTSLGRGRMIEANPRTKPWRDLMAWQIRAQTPSNHVTYDCPVFLVALFTMPKHGSVPKRTRSWPAKKTKGSGDEDKLVRAACDALTAAKVWADDARMVRHLAATDWVDAPGFRSSPGAVLIVVPIDEYRSDLIFPWIEELTSDN